ncbi:MAG: sigma-70 family RNA polymerase sigma factor [Chloroflexi bacterium]|nr:sigma-70 family RNA polymerase sigma factor [Chloroflexota bacterium]
MNTADLEFDKIYTTFQPKILRYLTYMVGEADAEDLTQDVFVKVNKSLENFRGESQLSTWIYRIATNTALDKLRNPSFQQVEPFLELNESQFGGRVFPEGQRPPIEKELIREEMNDCIRGYIEKLPADYRVVLVLSEWEELKNIEIAEILGTTLGTVKIRLHRAKAKLKEELENHCEFYWVEEMPCRVK